MNPYTPWFTVRFKVKAACRELAPSLRPGFVFICAKLSCVALIALLLTGCGEEQQQLAEADKKTDSQFLVKEADNPPASDLQPQGNRKIQQIKPHSGGDPHKALGPQKLLEVARQHYEEGRPALAEETLIDAYKRFPDNPELLSAHGSLLLSRGKVSEALRDFEKALALAPHDPVTLTNRAQAYRKFDRFDEAIRDLDSAIEINPDFLAARFNRAALFSERGENARALADLDYCIKLSPETPAPYFNRATVRQMLGQLDKAREDMNHFIKLSDNETWKQSAREVLASWDKIDQKK